jgi:ribosome modulation factor
MQNKSPYDEYNYQPDSIIEAYRRGRNDAFDGVSKRSNPYDEYFESIEFEQWENGWFDAGVEEF